MYSVITHSTMDSDISADRGLNCLYVYICEYLDHYINISNTKLLGYLADHLQHSICRIGKLIVPPILYS